MKKKNLSQVEERETWKEFEKTEIIEIKKESWRPLNKHGLSLEACN